MDKSANPQSIKEVKSEQKEVFHELCEEEEEDDDDEDEMEDEDIVAPDRVRYKCEWERCGRRFDFVEDLANHVNEDHVRSLKDEEYKCAWRGCVRKGRGFNARYKMLIHVRTHTNERPHQCSQCGKCFSRLENLKIHNRSHTGERPYICPISGCGKAYSNSSDRFKHTRTHFEEKPYICKMDGCNKRYTDPSSLRKHMKTYGHYRLGPRPGAPMASPGEPRSFYGLPHHLVTFEFSSLTADKVKEATESPSMCLGLISGANRILEDEDTCPLDLTTGNAVVAEDNYLQEKWGVVATD